MGKYFQPFELIEPLEPLEHFERVENVQPLQPHKPSKPLKHLPPLTSNLPLQHQGIFWHQIQMIDRLKQHQISNYLQYMYI